VIGGCRRWGGPCTRLWPQRQAGTQAWSAAPKQAACCWDLAEAVATAEAVAAAAPHLQRGAASHHRLQREAGRGAGQAATGGAAARHHRQAGHVAGKLLVQLCGRCQEGGPRAGAGGMRGGAVCEAAAPSVRLWLWLSGHAGGDPALGGEAALRAHRSWPARVLLRWRATRGRRAPRAAAARGCPGPSCSKRGVGGGDVWVGVKGGALSQALQQQGAA
jgi:hypothetical protein